METNSQIEVTEEEKMYYDALKGASKNISPIDLISRAWINMIIHKILNARKIIESTGYDSLPSSVKTTLSKYDVLIKGETHVLVCKALDGKNDKTFVALEESFKIVSSVHQLSNHGGVPEMQTCLSNMDYKVSSICLMTIIKVCSKCIGVEKAISYRNVNLRTGFVEIIDMSPLRDNQFCYMLIYQDIDTKFVQLRPLVSITNLNHQICIELIGLFSDIGPPKNILAFDLNQVMISELIAKINLMANLKILLYSIINDRVIDTYLTFVSKVQSALKDWMERESNESWSIGCCFVQWEMNNVIDNDGSTPFRKLFGRNPNKYKIPTKSLTQAPRKSRAAPENDSPQEIVNLDEDENQQTFPETDLTSEPEIEIEIEESDNIIVPDPLATEDDEAVIYMCCHCNFQIKSSVYTCCKCNHSMHLYCAQKMPGSPIQYICSTCALNQE